MRPEVANSLITALPERWLAVNCLIALLLVSAACASGARPPVAPRPVASEMALSEMAYEALNNRAGTIIVLDPRYGRVLKRVSRGTDVQFTSSPFEIAQIVTAYAALETGLITDKTLLPCDENGTGVDVTEALSRNCPAFFTELSRKLTRAQFAKAAEVIGFTYYGIESPTFDRTLMRPVIASIPERLTSESFAALAVKGTGMEARDLHFAQMASSLASGATSSERFAAYLMVNARAAAPKVYSFNRQALAIVQRGLVKAVDEGVAKAAAQIDQKVAGRIGGGDGHALFISYAPATDPQVALVVYLNDAVGRDAAEVAGKFYQSWFSKK